MECKEAEKLVIPFLRNELQAEETEQFISHVRSCEVCREELEIYYTIHHMLQSDDDMEETSYDVRQMIEEELETRLAGIRRDRRKKRVAYILIAVGIILLALLVVIALRPDDTVRLFYQIREYVSGWRMRIP